MDLTPAVIALRTTVCQILEDRFPPEGFAITVDDRYAKASADIVAVIAGRVIEEVKARLGL